MAGEHQDAPRRPGCDTGIEYQQVVSPRRQADRGGEAPSADAVPAGVGNVDEDAGAIVEPAQPGASDVEQPDRAVGCQRDIGWWNQAAKPPRRVGERCGPARRVLQHQRAIQRRCRDAGGCRRDRPAALPFQQHPGRVVGRSWRRIAEARGAAHATDPIAVGSVNTVAVTDCTAIRAPAGIGTSVQAGAAVPCAVMVTLATRITSVTSDTRRTSTK